MPGLTNRYVATIGEILVEVMRPSVNIGLDQCGDFVGPYPSGAPAIFIDALSKLGVPTGIAGCVGNDGFGRLVMDRLARDGVDVSEIQVRRDKSTGVAFVSYFDSGQREFIFHLQDSAAGQIDPGAVNRDWLEHVHLLHINGCSLAMNQQTYDLCYEAARTVKQNGGIVTFDPNIRRELLVDVNIEEFYHPFLRYCDYIIPSEGECELLTSAHGLDDAVEKLFKLGVVHIICKQGDKGCVLRTPAITLEVPAFHVEAVDPTGAGDCFNAGVVYGLLSQWEWRDILRVANAMGALATRKRGPMEGTVSLAEVMAFMASAAQQ